MIIPPVAVFAVDPGNTSGWAVLNVGPDPTLAYFGGINFTLKREQRSACMVLGEMVHVWRNKGWNFGQFPVLVAIEDQFLKKGPKRNVDTLKKLSRNSGRWQDAACHHGLEVIFVNPSTWITAELGRGLRSAQVEKLARQKVQTLYGHQVGRKLTEHECCAILIGRYQAIQEWRKALR